MTDTYRSQTIDLNPLGLESIRIGLDGLTRTYSVPRKEEEVQLDGSLLEAVAKELHSLQKGMDLWYNGQVPLYDFLINLKAQADSKIGRKTLSKKFWEHVPKTYKPSEGDTFEALYELKTNLRSEIDLYSQEDTKKCIRKLNTDLANLSYDIRLMQDGHYYENLATFVDKSWATDRQLGKTIDPDPKIPPMSIGRWGDVGSSDEDEILAHAVRSLTKSKESKNPGINLPLDFDQCFPMLGERIEKLCSHWGWEKRMDDSVKLRNQGLVPFSEMPDGTIKCELQNNERLALLSMYACVGALFLKPQSLAEEDSTEVALTYVCSVIAREKLAQDQDKELLKIALKNGDGGKAVFANRLYFLTKSGSSGIKMIFESLEKLVSKFARELKDDQLDKVTSQAISSRAFTSIDGMLGNCYRRTAQPIYESRTVAGKKTRQQVKTGEKLVFSPPDLSSSKLPLKATEMTKVNTLKSEFNDRKTIVENRIGKVAEPTIFTAPRMCKEVVAEAYQKLQPYKVILKSRVTKIREEATKANNGAKPRPGDWAVATTVVLNNTPDIDEEVWNFLHWLD